MTEQWGGEWTRSKLDCVEKYAAAYLQVMQQQARYDLHYVDAFAGRGKQILKSGRAEDSVVPDVASFFGTESDRADAEAFLMGSALRALAASRTSRRPFNHFTFIDAHRPSCAELLSAVTEEFPEAAEHVDVLCEDANSALRMYVEAVDWRKTRALVFLDPFGLEVSWDTLECLAGSGACDVWYLFPLGGAIRMMRKDGVIPDAWHVRLDRLFGTHDWYSEFYSTMSQGTLFDGEESIVRKDAPPSHVVRYVRERLLQVFPAVSKPGILYNRNGFPLFALILGVSNPSERAQGPALRIGNHLILDLARP